MVATIAREGAKPSYVRKVLQATAMLFDHAGITPNPARDKTIVKLPRDVRPEVAPPTAEHVLAVHALLPSRYRLPLLVLDATGMRLGELEASDVGRHGRAAGPLARLGGRQQDEPGPLGDTATRGLRGRRTALVPRDDRAPDAAPSSRASPATGSAPRSRGPAPPPPSRRSARTTSGTAGSACSTLGGVTVGADR